MKRFFAPNPRLVVTRYPWLALDFRGSVSTCSMFGMALLYYYVYFFAVIVRMRSGHISWCFYPLLGKSTINSTSLLLELRVLSTKHVSYWSNGYTTLILLGDVPNSAASFMWR